MLEKFAKQISEIENKKKELTEILNNAGITADTEEQLNTLVPKVANIDVYSIGNKTPDTEGYVIANGITSTGAIESIETVGMKTIPKSMFYRISDLVNLTIGEGTTIIRNQAVASCGSLTNLTLPKTLTHLYVGVFSGCTALDNVHLYNGIVYMDTTTIPFDKCTGIKNFTVEEGFNCSLNLSPCTNLTLESAKNIILNYAENSGKTFKVHANVLALLEQDGEILEIAENKGLTVGA